MPPTYDSIAAPDIPSTESRLGKPDLGFSLLLVAVFVAIGLAILSRLFFGQPPADPPEWFGTIILGGAFLLFPFLLTIALVNDRRTNRPFRHASQEARPEVPRTPLLAPGQISFSFVTHRLETMSSGLQLVPDPRPFRLRTRLGYLWINVCVVAVAGLVWWLGRGPDLSLALVACITTAFALIGNLVVWIIDYLARREYHKLCTLEIDNLADRCLLQRPSEPPLTIERSRVMAVQLCAARRRIDPHRAASIRFAALELNLVWSEGSATGEPSIHRATLLNLRDSNHRVVPLARQLADALGVPLLNHATDQDWQRQRDAVKHRPPETEGGYM